MLFRIYFYQQLVESGIEFKMVQTIHDSIVVDTPSKNLDFVAALAHKCIAKVPELCYNNWSYKFSLPLTVEVKYGINKKEMTEWHSK